jgi:hypothetical protein
MCIACELGYLSMIDALEAERNASQKKAARAEAIDFACDVPAEQPGRTRRRRAPRPSDEPAP